MEFREPRTGKIIPLEEIAQLVNENYDYKLYIGTDSQVHKKIKKVMYSTSIVMHKKVNGSGKGGTFWVWREEQPFANSLRERLSKEVWRSLQTCFALMEILAKDPKDINLEVHVDVNPSRKYKSGEFYKYLEGMVTSQGFTCVVKPYAWAAQHVADKYSRKKRRKGRRRR